MAPDQKRLGSPALRWLAVLIVAAAAVYFWGGNLADEDLWNHLHFGEQKLRDGTMPLVDHSSYSAAGHPWFNHEWLAEVVFALLFRAAGAAGLFGLKLGLGAIVLACCFDAIRTATGARRVGERIHPATLAACLVLVLAVVAPGASFRPQLFTMTFLAVEWALLERADRRLTADGNRRRVGWELALVPPLVGLWANCHGGFLVGVALHGIFTALVCVRTLAARVGDPAAAPWRALALVALSGCATLAAGLVNPYGLGLYRYLAQTLHQHGQITEWMPVHLFSADHLRFKALVLTTAAVVAPWWWARRVRLVALVDWRVAFAAFAAWYGFRHQRHTVLFAIAVAPLFVVAAEDARRRLVAWRPAFRPRRRVAAAIGAGAAAVACLQLAQVIETYARDGLTIRYSRDEFPADAIEFVRAHGLGGNMAVQFEWGGYTLAHLGDRARVFIDGRFEASYPPAVMDDYFAFVEGAPGWERVLDAYPTEIVMLERTAPVQLLLDARPDFVRVYADPTAIVYVRRTPTNAAVLEALTAMAGRAPLPERETVFP